MLAAIHQPNYVPWLGYFHKIARADIFVFLDDVQFSKQSYTNRVQILGPNGRRWLTVPVKVTLGQAINEVRPARPDWSGAHLDTLRGAYQGAPAFKASWPEVEAMYRSVPEADLAKINRHLVEATTHSLGLEAHFRTSSEMDLDAAVADDRLVAIASTVAPGGAYLSGKGGASYQHPSKFAAAGLHLVYSNFEHPTYTQAEEDFVPGLSILDAIFNLGWDGAAALVGGGQ